MRGTRGSAWRFALRRWPACDPLTTATYRPTREFVGLSRVQKPNRLSLNSGAQLGYGFHQLRDVTGLLEPDHVLEAVRYDFRTVAGGENKRYCRLLQLVGDHIDRLVAQIDIQYGNVKTAVTDLSNSFLQISDGSDDLRAGCAQRLREIVG